MLLFFLFGSVLCEQVIYTVFYNQTAKLENGTVFDMPIDYYMNDMKQYDNSCTLDFCAVGFDCGHGAVSRCMGFMYNQRFDSGIYFNNAIIVGMYNETTLYNYFMMQFNILNLVGFDEMQSYLYNKIYEFYWKRTFDIVKF